MEGMRRGCGFGSPVMTLVAMVVMLLVVVVPEVSATRWTVGANMGWSPNVNYTIWAKDKHFYNGDWLCKFSIFTPLLFHNVTSFRSVLVI